MKTAVPGAERGDAQSPVTGSRIAHNTLLNFAGQAVPILVALVSMPFVTRGLGAERFGLLGIAWVVLGYASVFDLGLGRATTRFVAEALGTGQVARVPRLIWTSVIVQCGFAVLGAVVMFSVTPVLITGILHIPADLVAESRTSLQVLALALPAVMVSGSLRGALEALQRFDLVNAIRSPSSAANYLAPLLGVVLGWGLPKIVILLVLVRWLTLLAWGVAVIRYQPGSMSVLVVDRGELKRLASFGGWVMAANVASPLLIYLDRLLLGGWQSLAAVGYYTAPVETVNRTSIIPSSIVQTIFPTISGMGDDYGKLSRLYAKAVKFMLVIMGMLVLVLVILSSPILTVLSGADFALYGASAFRVLCVGALVNSLARISYALLDGTGRPDILSKLLVLELPAYVGIAWWLIPRYGVLGAGLASSIRLAGDTLLAGFVAHRSGHLRLSDWRQERVPVLAVALVVTLVFAFAASSLDRNLVSVVGAAVAVSASYGAVAWRFAFSAEDRSIVPRLLLGYAAVLKGRRS